MSLLRSLCCGSSSRETIADPNPKLASGTRPAQMSTSPEPSKLPVPPSKFAAYLNDESKTATRDVLKPYLDYELWLRRTFAQGDTRVDGLANLVPVYGSSGGVGAIKSRNTDRQRESADKYLMRLHKKRVPVDGTPAIAESLDGYRRNFEAFTHGVLEGLDWSHVAAAGSSALLPLLPQRQDIRLGIDTSVEDPLETYYQRTAASSDIDLFIHGLDEEAAVNYIQRIEAVIRKNQRLHNGSGLTLRTQNAVTFVSPRWPYRHVQIILRLYKSVSEILTGFDVDCACVAYDGKQVYSNPRGVAAIATRTNIIDLTRRSPSYENRLYKYRSHLFDAYWDSLDRSRIDESKCNRTAEKPNVEGLARLIFFEEILRTRKDNYKRRRLLKTIDENGEPTHSGYATLEVPYGEQFTAGRVRKFIAIHSKEPYAFGTIEEVLGKRGKPKKHYKGDIGDTVAFVKDNPGRQMIGSFHPLTQDDWTKMAYGQE